MTLLSTFSLSCWVMLLSSSTGFGVCRFQYGELDIVVMNLYMKASLRANGCIQYPSLTKVFVEPHGVELERNWT
jgi:hypothetical protein